MVTACVQTLAEKGRVCRRPADHQPRAVLSSSSLSPAAVTLQVPRARADTQHYPDSRTVGPREVFGMESMLGVGSTCSAAGYAQPRAGRHCSSACHLKKKTKNPPHRPQQEPRRGPKSYPDSQSEAWRTNAALIHFVRQRQQAHHAAAGVPGERELSHHHDRAHLGRRRQLRRNPVHHPDRLEGVEDEEKENEGKELPGVQWRKALLEPHPGAGQRF